MNENKTNIIIEESTHIKKKKKCVYAGFEVINDWRDAELGVNVNYQWKDVYI